MTKGHTGAKLSPMTNIASQLPRALVLADIQNLYHTARAAHQKNIDYNQLWAELSSRYEIAHAFAYAVDRGDPKQQQFQNILRAIGFTVRLKPFIQRADGSAKGDWDVGITIDAMEFSKEVDTVILLSGDGDFAMLTEHLRNRHNNRIEVYSVEALTAQSLIRTADRYVSLAEFLL